MIGAGLGYSALEWSPPSSYGWPVPDPRINPVARLRWSARKLNLGIPRGGLVLDAGSGGAPNPRADILLEKTAASRHRLGVPLVRDRPLVYGDGFALPFRDKAFDFVVLSHVLEHISNPAPFLKEIERVGRAGYIETPNVLFERLDPYEVHVLEVRHDGDLLRLRKKSAAVPDPFLGELRLIANTSTTPLRRHLLNHPEEFHVRYWWREHINFTVENPDEDTSWFDSASHSHGHSVGTAGAATGLRRFARTLAHRYARVLAR